MGWCVMTCSLNAHMYQVSGQGDEAHLLVFRRGMLEIWAEEGHVDKHSLFGHDHCCRWQAILVIAEVMHSLEGDQVGEAGLQVGIKILVPPVLQEPALHIG